MELLDDERVALPEVDREPELYDEVLLAGVDDERVADVVEREEVEVERLADDAAGAVVERDAVTVREPAVVERLPVEVELETEPDAVPDEVLRLVVTLLPAVALDDARDTLFTADDLVVVAVAALEVLDVERVAVADERDALSVAEAVREDVAPAEREPPFVLARVAPISPEREAFEFAERAEVTLPAEGRTLVLPKVLETFVPAVREPPARAPSARRGCKSRALVTLRSLLRASKLFSGCLIA